MTRRLPSMTALSCFEAAAKHQSFTKAAEELCLTQSAVSRQIKTLEQALGCALFDRVKQRLYLSNAGKQYQREVSQSLTQLEIATNALRKKLSGRLQIGIESAMTTHWLIPKLTDFQQHFPEIETDIITETQQLYEQRSGYDVGILYGDGRWPEFTSQRLMSEEFVAVCSPSLLMQYGKIENLKDVLNYPFLHHATSPSSSEYWLQQAGLCEQEIKALPGMRFAQFQLLIDAAIHGLGVAIVPSYLIFEELKKGVLVCARETRLKSKDSYYMVIQKNKIDDNKVQAFSQWLLKWRNL